MILNEGSVQSQVFFDTQGVVNSPTRLVDSVWDLADGQEIFFWEFKLEQGEREQLRWAKMIRATEKDFQAGIPSLQVWIFLASCKMFSGKK